MPSYHDKLSFVSTNESVEHGRIYAAPFRLNPLIIPIFEIVFIFMHGEKQR